MDEDGGGHFLEHGQASVHSETFSGTKGSLVIGEESHGNIWVRYVEMVKA